MATITTRSGKGSPLTNAEVDANFTNLNNDKVEKSGTDPVVISVNSSSDALRITQTGAGNALVVEDSANPDSSPVVIDGNGYAILGNTSVIPCYGFSNQFEILSTSNSYQLNASFRNDAFSNLLTLAHSRNGTVGAHTIIQSGDDLGGLAFAGSDGTAFIRGAQISAAVDGTPGTNDMPGRLVFSVTRDGASSPTEAMRIDNPGNVVIGGSSSVAGQSFRARKNITGAVNSSGIVSQATIQSDVTSSGLMFSSYPSTADAAFTLASLVHYDADQGTITGGSRTAPTSQFGFRATSSLTGATNNYGFYSNIASGTGRYNFYAAGTADNYFAGAVGIGTTAGAGYSAYIGKNPTGATATYGLRNGGTIQSDVTTGHNVFYSRPATAAASFTSGYLYHYRATQGTIGAGSTLTSQAGFIVDSDLIGATTNRGFESNIASGTGRWNFYAGGTADNYFAGKVGIGTTAAASENLTLSKAITGGTTATNLAVFGQVQTDVTTLARGIYTQIPVAASTTLGSLYHYSSYGGAFGSGASVTTQIGYFAESSLTGATNNYGFYSNIASGTGRYNFYAAGTADNYFAGAVGIGGVPLAQSGIYNVKNITGATTSYNQLNTGVVQSDVTTNAYLYAASGNTAASAFALTTLGYFYATQGSIGAGSTVSNQYGFSASNTLTGATNNFGFYSNIAFGSGRYNFYAAGTADNYFAGKVGIGTGPGAAYGFINQLSISGGATSVGTYLTGQVQSDVSDAWGVRTDLRVAAAAFTLATLNHFGASQDTIGSGATVTSQYGFSARGTITGATNNYGFYSNIASGTGRYNFYAAGTAGNYFAGNVGIGTTSLTNKLEIGGSGDSIMRLLAAGQTNGLEIGQLTADGGSKIFTANNNYLALGTNNTERMRIDNAGNIIQSAPTTAPTLSTNGTMVFNLTSNTNLRVSVRGSDGVTRTANLTLA